ncbi:uncharacterized protein MONOS_4380 [Monocercomonoides exilis]|uniref:uncharacterized protein n=1 Tax=Monocercomonoides exilis TaxID=2049356 RepID=UPI00355A02C0|nr:hypothetical protein MONOS_4380 [Monocercomonoides exilis]|eukprot:MONOS_4380.1-p1 / transcript=MONOS_4380.1 / gene=MONOS_4380 / organism=Monocercomonoides_exilis_PA203 / gene_product=unspecified product / transcript_product=unspecified product / location=Mono_scaffold00116:7644-9107(+) / protein_length=488 / sequence_SO=supercontig / SO=protein_coding / is_pseudo=false
MAHESHGTISQNTEMEVKESQKELSLSHLNITQHVEHKEPLITYVDGEMKFVCPYEGCTSSFTKKYSYKIHELHHTHERPHVCPFKNCHKAYTQRYYLKLHIASKHKNAKKQNLDEKERNENDEFSEDDENDYFSDEEVESTTQINDMEEEEEKEEEDPTKQDQTSTHRQRKRIESHKLCEEDQLTSSLIYTATTTFPFHSFVYGPRTDTPIIKSQPTFFHAHYGIYSNISTKHFMGSMKKQKISRQNELNCKGVLFDDDNEKLIFQKEMQKQRQQFLSSRELHFTPIDNEFDCQTNSNNDNRLSSSQGFSREAAKLCEFEPSQGSSLPHNSIEADFILKPPSQVDILKKDVETFDKKASEQPEIKDESAPPMDISTFQSGLHTDLCNSFFSAYDDLRSVQAELEQLSHKHCNSLQDLKQTLLSLQNSMNQFTDIYRISDLRKQSDDLPSSLCLETSPLNHNISLESLSIPAVHETASTNFNTKAIT